MLRKSSRATWNPNPGRFENMTEFIVPASIGGGAIIFLRELDLPFKMMERKTKPLFGRYIYGIRRKRETKIKKASALSYTPGEDSAPKVIATGKV